MPLKSYLKVEIIGGNHRRVVLRELLQEGELARQTISRLEQY